MHADHDTPDEMAKLHPAVLRNQLSKAEKVLASLTDATPGEYGYTAESIARMTAWWTTQRDLCRNALATVTAKAQARVDAAAGAR